MDIYKWWTDKKLSLDEKIERVKNGLKEEKIEFLLWCCEKYSSDVELVEKALYSIECSSKDVANIPNDLLTKYTKNKRIINMLVEFANKTWIDLGDPQEVYKTKMKIIGSEDVVKLYILEYFKQNNLNMYLEFSDLLKNKMPVFYFEKVIMNSDKNLQYEEIKEILSKCVSHQKASIFLDLSNLYGSQPDLVKKLLDSSIVEPKTIAYIERYRLDKLINEDYEKLLIDFANKSWTCLTDPEEILMAKVKIIGTEVESKLCKLSYFEKHNVEIYKGLLDLVKEKYPKVYFQHLLINPDKHKEEIIEAITQDKSLYDVVPNNEKYKDIFNELKKMNEKIKKEKGWKEEKSYQIIMYSATEKNKWEILEYFAQHSPYIFNSIIKNHTFVSNRPTNRIGYNRNELINRYKDVDFDTLPETLQNCITMFKQELENERLLEEEKKRQKNEKEMIDTDWENANFFEINKIKLEKRRDYEFVLAKFLESDLSVKSFCEKYKLSDEEGFKKMLKAFSKEDKKYEEKILTKQQSKQKRYFLEAINLVEGVCSGDKSVECVLEYSRSYSFNDLLKLIDSFENGEDYRDIFISKVVSYYFERLNSFTNVDIDEENIKKMLTFSEMRFILGKEMLENMSEGLTIDASSILVSALLKIKNQYKKIPINNKQIKLFRERLSKCSMFDKKAYLKWETVLEDDKGNKVVVTEKIVNQAISYARANHLCTSNTVIKTIIRAIVRNKISNIEDIERQSLENKSLEVEDEVTVIDNSLSAKREGRK